MNETRSAWTLFFAVALFYIFWIAIEQEAPREQAIDQPGVPVEERFEMPSRPAEVVDSADAIDRVAPQARSRELVVRGDVLEVVLDTRGASVVGATVLDHVYGPGHSSEGLAIEIVNARTSGGAGATYLVDRVGGIVDLAEVVFECEASPRVELFGADSTQVVFRAELADGTVVSRRYLFWGDRHSFESSIDYEGPERVGAYYCKWGVPLRLTETHAKMDQEYFKGLVMEDAKLEDLKLKDVDRGDRWGSSGRVDWAGARTRYFLVAMIPAERADLSAEVAGVGDRAAPEGFEVVLRRGRVGRRAFSERHTMYIGPLDYDELKTLGRDVDRAVDFGGSFLRPISRVIFEVMVHIRKVIPSYGLVIIVVSLLVKAIFWPLTHKSFESSAKMRALSPKIKQLQEKHKSNPQKQQQEMMKLYREHGVNPLGGCLPMIVQMPVLYALFIVFRSTIAFRGEPFLGYIPDLSAPDPYWILPLVMGVSMLLQQKVMAQMVTDPRQKMLGYMMPVIFTALFLNMPSGLVLYWTVSNVASIIQQILINRRSVEGATL